ncbi:MAG: ComEA family DNA-binding protein [Coriobacteriia bacterium]|nr:ComEA family DNA-binding protein [Coriobacteriia bacterium]
MPFLDEVECARDKLPTGRLSRPVLLGIASFAVVIAILAALGVASSARGDFVMGNTASSSSAAIEATEESPAQSSSSSSDIAKANPCVYVVGAVKHPGVYTVSSGARVADALEAAGGFAKGADTVAVNLARPVVDGEQITVPKKGDEDSEGTTRGDTGVMIAGEPAAIGAADGKVNINSASATELEALPGIGSAIAEKIIASRQAEGPFTAPEELKRVSGIGDKKYAAIADLITI